MSRKLKIAATTTLRGGGGGENSSDLLGVKKAVFVTLRVFNLKWATAVVGFSVLSQKSMTGDNVLCKNR